MGVRLLSTYCRNVGALTKIKLSDEVLNWRHENPNIVIDGFNFMVSIMSIHKLDFVEGRTIDFAEHLRKLIRKICSLGCTITVFLKGANWMFNEDKWIRRRQDKIRRIMQAFDAINNNAPIEKIKEYSNPLLPNSWSVFAYVLLDEGCEVRNSVEDCDAEIISYVKEKNSMAIIGNDSNFIINAPCSIYLTRTMNAKSLSFMKIDKVRLLTSLDLHERHLPLFATLLGKMLFKTIFCERKISSMVDKVEFISQYIKSLKIGEEITDATFERISLDTFGNIDNVDLLKKCIESYQLNSAAYLNTIVLSEDRNWNDIVKEVYMSNLNSTSRILDVIIHNTYQGAEKFEDFREIDIPPFYLVTRKLRQKIFGILLLEKPGNRKPVIEMAVTSATEFKPHLTEAIFPTVHHPGLIALWGSNNHELDKWKLLADIFGISFMEITTIPETLVVPALTMKYLLKEVILEKWEVSAVLLSCILLKSLKQCDLTEIVVRQMHSRAVRIYSLVTHTFSDIIFLLDVLHGPISPDKYCPVNYAYGALFHIVYKALQFGQAPMFIIRKGFSLKDYMGVEKVFNQIMDFVYKA